MDRAMPTLTPALGRLLLSAIFIQSGLMKASAVAGTTQYMAGLGIPMPDLAVWATIAVELGGGILVLIGLLTRPVAVVMALFCLATAGIAHFHPGDQANMVQFMKNLSMAGGFLVLAAFGPGGWSVDAALERRRSPA